MRRHAHVDRTPGDPEADASVLRQALLGDVELRHDLDARDDQRRDGAPALQDFAQHAVDAEAHHQAVFERLDVDVRGVFLHRLREHRVDETDDGRVVFALEQVGLFGQVLREVREVGGFLHACRRPPWRRCRLRRPGAAASRSGLLRPSRAQRNAEIAAHLGDRQRRHAGAIDALGDAFVHAAHQHAVALGEGEADALRTNDLGRGDLVHGLGGVAFAALVRVAAKPAAPRAPSRPDSWAWRAADSHRGSGAGIGGRRGSGVKGSSGRTSVLGRIVVRCSSRM